MNYVLVHHQVSDFAKWKPIYDAHESARQKAGLKEVSLLHKADDDNDVTLLFEAKDIERAKAFTESDDLKDAMKRAGVVGKPDVTLLKD
jgi:hypothetical protein